MKRLVLFASILLLAVPVLCKDMLKDLAPAYHVSGDMVQAENLTIWPLTSDVVMAKAANFVTLEQGIKTGTVVVEEMKPGLVRGSSASNSEVNQLVIVNKSSQPLLLLAGEVVTGGHQDRVIQEDRIVPPNSDPLPLSVFCVEPNRWTGPSGTFTGAMIAAPSVRASATIADANQQSVWATSANTLSLAGTATSIVLGSTSAETGHVEYVQSSGLSTGNSNIWTTAAPSYSTIETGPVKSVIDKESSEIETKLERKFSGQFKADNVIGVVVAVNGEVIWMDAFINHDLFRSYWPKLLRAYVAEAVSRERGSVVDIKADNVKSFMSKGGKQVLSVDPDDVYGVIRTDSGDEHLEGLVSYIGTSPELIHVTRFIK